MQRLRMQSFPLALRQMNRNALGFIPRDRYLHPSLMVRYHWRKAPRAGGPKTNWLVVGFATLDSVPTLFSFANGE